jgi:hypothetical protein
MKKYISIILVVIFAVGTFYYLSGKRGEIPKPILWKTYYIGSQYQIDYPDSFNEETKGYSYGTTTTFENKEKKVIITVSSVATGWGEDWKQCAPSDQAIVIDANVNILYLCNGGSYRIIASTGGEFSIVAGVPEEEFYSPEMRSLFRQMVSSWTVQ